MVIEDIKKHLIHMLHTVENIENIEKFNENLIFYFYKWQAFKQDRNSVRVSKYP